MIWVCLFFAVALAVVAWRAKDEGVGLRVFWLAMALLNAGAAVDMIATDFHYTWRLAPSGEWSFP
jgi:disulfide bond formation protein DsbB